MLLNEKFSKITPALAKANKGIIPKATYGDNECSKFNNRDLPFSLFLCGIAQANKTPDIVAWTPDSCVKYHNSNPKNKYGEKIFMFNLFKNNNKENESTSKEI